MNALYDFLEITSRSFGITSILPELKTILPKPYIGFCPAAGTVFVAQWQALAKDNL
jgi:hypothetical protein